MRLSHETKLLFFIAVAAFLLRAAFAFRPEPDLTARLHDDDSFYVHTVSRNLAEGKGLSADGVHPTNGVQPLMVFLNAPAYMISGGDRWLGLRFSIIIAALIDALSVIMVYHVTKKLMSGDEPKVLSLSPPLLASALWAFLYPVIAQTMNGLETGVYSLSLLISFYLLLRDKKDEGRSFRSALLIGISLGFAVLARIDAVIFVVLVVGWYGFREKKYRKAMTIGGLAFLISSPWWIYNYTVFGSLMPTSGQAESVGGPSLGENILHLVTSLADILSLAFIFPREHITDTFGWAWRLIGIGIIFMLCTKLRGDVKRFFQYPELRLFFAFSIVLAVYYSVFFHAPYFLSRYLQPFRILFLIFVALNAGIFFSRSKYFASVISKPKFISFAFVIILLFGYSTLRYAHLFTRADLPDLAYAGMWAKEHKGYVGMQQSGTAGFIADNVVNLDGKVNAEAMSYLKEGKRGEYIAEKHFEYLVDWVQFAKVLVDEARGYGVRYQLIDSFKLIRIYKLTADSASRH